MAEEEKGKEPEGVKQYSQNLTLEQVKDRINIYIAENADIVIKSLALKYGVNIYVEFKIDIERKGQEKKIIIPTVH